jgi:hypothetical protein
MGNKVLETGIYCPTCNCIIKEKDLSEWECGQCDTTDNWEHIEVVLKGKWIPKD